jgi:hypothetical protein
MKLLSYGTVFISICATTESFHFGVCRYEKKHPQRFVVCTALKRDYLEGEGGSEDETMESVGANSSNRKASQGQETEAEDDAFLGYAIDSFLRGAYDPPFADDVATPNPDWSPGTTVEVALRSLRQLDEPSQGASVFLRFCLPLSRGERWGDTSTSGRDTWKEVLRGALTPSMFSRRLRASEFSELLEWDALDVTEGAYSTEDLVGIPNIAFVNVAFYFDANGIEPSIMQVTLRKKAGVWLIDTARRSQKELFVRNS